MRKLMLPGALAIGALAVALPVSAGGQTPSGRTITLFDLNKGSTFGFVDNPPTTTHAKNGAPKRLSAGDVIAFSNPVQSARHTPLGRVNVTCTVTKPGSFRTYLEVCTGAFRLRGGDLLLAATLKGQPKRATVAVTGGTGTYEGARGSMTFTTTKTGSTDVIHLLP